MSRHAMHQRILFVICVLLFSLSRSVSARDYFLTLGGGYSRDGNQASLEKNVLFYQRVLTQQNVDPRQHAVYFADGLGNDKDLQVKDVEAIPKANRLMAEFFGSERDLGLYYRNHEVPGVRGSTNPANIREWFSDVGPDHAPWRPARPLRHGSRRRIR